MHMLASHRPPLTNLKQSQIIHPSRSDIMHIPRR